MISFSIVTHHIKFKRLMVGRQALSSVGLNQSLLLPCRQTIVSVRGAARDERGWRPHVLKQARFIRMIVQRRVDALSRRLE